MAAFQQPMTVPEVIKETARAHDVEEAQASAAQRDAESHSTAAMVATTRRRTSSPSGQLRRGATRSGGARSGAGVRLRFLSLKFCLE